MKGMAVAVAIPFIEGVKPLKAFSVDRLGKYNVLCCNIRVALEEDDKLGYGWKDRKTLCIEVIKAQQPDIICLQEVLRIQNEDLKKAFPAYQSLGFEGPEMDFGDGGYNGIAKNPIFFSLKRFELLAAGTYWLSETPLIAASVSWDTARARNVSWVRLKDKQTGKEFRVVNLHLDHKSNLAKNKQIELALNEAAQYHEKYPQILTGDLNSTMATAVYRQVKDAGWIDTYTSVNGTQEPGATVHAFKGELYVPKKDSGKIDFVFSKGGFSTNRSIILKDHKGDRYPSDHYFLSAEMQL